jgi:flagellar biosynthesis/type III secretory pathway ATPase
MQHASVAAPRRLGRPAWPALVALSGPICRRTPRAAAAGIQGTLVRVTGLVLEAAGIRVPVGSVCEMQSDGPGRAPVLAEVVGFTATAPS